MATGGVAAEPRNLQATEIQGFSVRCRKSRCDLAAQESQKVSGESLFDLIVTVERRKKYIIPTVEYLGPWKIFALSEKWGDIMVNWNVQGMSVQRGLLVEFDKLRRNQNGLLLKSEQLNNSKKAKAGTVTAKERWN